jgi:response regulator of citrate/malate metabolism
MITVLVVDDDFRVAGVHAAFVDRVPGLKSIGIAHTAAQAQQLIGSLQPDLILLDNYLPDRPGIELLPELSCDVILITADATAKNVRAAFAAGALGYLIKPFGPETLIDRLRAYQKYRTLLSTHGETTQDGVDRALMALHAADRPPAVKGQSPVTARLVADALHNTQDPLSATDLAEQLGIARATAQRYLTALVEAGEATMNLRYGSAGRPEHEYLPTD